MVKKTLEAYECDICGNNGDRYVIVFPDGSLALDRCERHRAAIMKLKDEKGSWTKTTPGGKSAFRLSSPDDIKAQQK